MTMQKLNESDTEQEVLIMPSNVTKRDGRVVSFNSELIENALQKCFSSIGRTPDVSIKRIAQQAINVVSSKYDQPTVENIQDIVEMTLQAVGEFNAAKHYILYRAEHAKMRQSRPVPSAIRAAFEESDSFFPTQIQKFQFYDKYSRFNYELGHRETWVETVDRATDYLKELSGNKLPQQIYDRIRKGILEMKAMPSMRLLAMAGPAARRNNIAIYNCSYMPVDSIDSFVEALVISMSGCGVGYSVEKAYVENFPRVHRQIEGPVPTLVVEDSAEGWANALRTGLQTWFDGHDMKFDYSQIRQAGAPLRIKGGRASGPEPLRKMLDFARNRILAQQGGFLRTIDAHDIMCEVGNAAVSGGVRRTAMIALFDYDDMEMRRCKSGDFERENSQRWNANNSVVWPDRKLTQLEIFNIIADMHTSGRGEPGIFNRRAATNTVPERRKKVDFGTNPCGEIVLRPYELCNLSIAVARSEDTYETLKDKVELATIIGTIQSMATNFPGLRDIWKKNCEEERLLGVDINGQLDSPVAQNEMIQELLKEFAIETNKKYAKLLGINQASSVTTVKPSGNSSQLLDCSAGIHSRWSPYYVRNIRVGAHSPIFKVLKDAEVPMSPENGQSVDDATTWVIHFPVKAPKNAITRGSRTALVQCEYWLQTKLNWTEHNPSVTITYKPDEIIDIIKWVWEHQDVIGGMTFLPSYDALFNQMPYEEIDEDHYNQLVAKFPNIDFAKLYYYEEKDLTTAAQELACLAGVCSLDL